MEENTVQNLIAERAITNLCEAYRQMPNGGALLTIWDGGAVGNGLAVVARFTSNRAASFWLRAEGFVPDRNGRWRHREFINWDA